MASAFRLSKGKILQVGAGSRRKGQRLAEKKAVRSQKRHEERRARKDAEL